MNQTITLQDLDPKCLSCLYDFYKSKLFVDCTVTCKNFERFSLHRVVLAAASEYFRDLFEVAQGEPHVFVDSITKDIFEIIVQFIYTGNATVKNPNYEELMAAAKTLKFISFEAALQRCLASRLGHLAISPKMSTHMNWIAQNPHQIHQLSFPRAESSKRLRPNSIKVAPIEALNPLSNKNPLHFNLMASAKSGQFSNMTSSHEVELNEQNRRAKSNTPTKPEDTIKGDSVNLSLENALKSLQTLRRFAPMRNNLSQASDDDDDESTNGSPPKKQCITDSKLAIGRVLACPSVVPPLSNLANIEDENKKQPTKHNDTDSEDGDNSAGEETDVSMCKFSHGSVSPNSDKENIGAPAEIPTHDKALFEKANLPESLTVNMNPSEVNCYDDEALFSSSCPNYAELMEILMKSNFSHGSDLPPYINSLPNKYTCTHCSKHFPDKHTAEEHFKRAHDCKEHVCDSCDKRYAWKSGLYKHKRSVHGLQKKENHSGEDEPIEP